MVSKQEKHDKASEGKEDLAELEIKTLQDLDDVIIKLKDIQDRLRKVVGEVPGDK